MVDVCCPFCGSNRTIVPKYGTDKKMINRKVRCTKGSEGCGRNFWYKSNIVVVVPQFGTKWIYQDKISTKDEIIKKIKTTLDKLEKFLPLDILRSKLLELEAIGGMRKK